MEDLVGTIGSTSEPLARMGTDFIRVYLGKALKQPRPDIYELIGYGLARRLSWNCVFQLMITTGILAQARAFRRHA